MDIYPIICIYIGIFSDIFNQLCIYRDGEIDTRSTYTVLAVARVLNIMTPGEKMNLEHSRTEGSNLKNMVYARQ